MLKIHTFTLYSLTTLMLLIHNHTNACEAYFTYDNSSKTGTIILEASTASTTDPYFSWNLGDGQFYRGETQRHTYSFSGDYLVCMNMRDNNCSETICQTISVTNQNGDNCTINECVYPGDTNRDGSANIYDLFSIGMHYGRTGPARPNASDTWNPQPTQNWNNNPTSTNLKHTDCNGDGIIDAEDLSPIIANYHNDHNSPPRPNNPSAPSIHLEFQDDFITIDSKNPGLVTAALDIMIGTETAPVSNLYALAFSLNFPNDLILPGSISMDYDHQSFFCHPTDLISLSKVAEDGTIDLAFSRTDQKSISGYGRIARISFTIIGDLVVSRMNTQGNQLPLEVETKGSIGIDKHGTDLGFATLAHKLTFKTYNADTPQKDNTNNNLFELSPNPSTGLVNLKIGKHQVNDVKVYDTNGKLLLRQTIQQNNLQKLDLGEFPNGTYMIKVSNDEESAMKRVVISR